MSTTSSSLDQVLGGEAHQLDANVEIEGVQAIMEALTADEMKALVDPSMPMRHFRAEKVRSRTAVVLCACCLSL